MRLKNDVNNNEQRDVCQRDFHSQFTIHNSRFTICYLQGLDEESKDMAATIVYALRELYETADTAAKAWEKRGYWMKAERFLRQWEWTTGTAANLEDIIREDAWDLLPQIMMEIFPYFTDIEVKSLTRRPETWQGAYARLLQDPPQNLLT